MTAQERWRDRAACRDVGPSLQRAFFANTPHGDRLILARCARCAVRAECVASAVDTRTEYGVWGGRTQPELRRLVAQAQHDHTGAAETSQHRNARKTNCSTATRSTRRSRRRCRHRPADTGAGRAPFGQTIVVPRLPLTQPDPGHADRAGS
jgi:WhiB family redox-sensing transcriptional regulator